MFFQVVTRTTIKMRAATIQVQIMEFVIGKPKTLKTSSAAAGTFDSAGAVESTGLATAGALPESACEAGCALAVATKTAAKNAQAKKIFLNWFTSNMVSDNTNRPASQTSGESEGGKSASREKFHKHFLEKF